MGENPAIKNLREDLTAEGALFLLDTEMKHFRAPRLAESLSFWQSKIGAEGVPFRRDFTPQSMRAFLPNVSLFEIVKRADGPSRIRARLTGPEFRRTFSEMSLKYVDEAVPPEFYRRWALIFHAAQAYGRPFRLVFVPEAFGREHSVVELLLAPLLDDAGEPNQFVVTLQLEFGAAWATVCAEEAQYVAPAPLTVPKPAGHP